MAILNALDSTRKIETPCALLYSPLVFLEVTVSLVPVRFTKPFLEADSTALLYSTKFDIEA